MKHIKLILCLALLSCYNLLGYPAFVTKPVIDLLGNPQSEYQEEDVYKHLHYCWEQSIKFCPRLYQLNLHDVVEVTEEQGEDLKVTVPGAYYLKAGCLCNEYWTLKSNIMPLSDVHMPQANDTKILLYNYYSPEHDIEFSSGTKFVANEVDNNYQVHFYHQDTQSFKTMQLNKNLFFKPSDDRIADFIRVLKTYCENEQGFVPYVWGGASNAYRLKQKYQLTMQEDGGYWEYENEARETKSGYDCSALILKSAQMVDLPFIYRNTFTMASLLKCLQASDVIEQGDLLFYKGHVCVVSDVENNLCIESRGYAEMEEQKVGRVREAHIQDLFVGIQNFDELKNAFLKGAVTQRYDANKNVKDIQDFKILKLKSIFTIDLKDLGVTL